MDTASNRADVKVEVRQGPRARIRAFEVSGNETVPAGHLTRQLPIGVGDWYDAEKLEQGRQQLIQLDIVRLALVDVPRQARNDSGVTVALKVTENPPNLVTGSAGYASDGGLSAEVEWVNRSFLGGVRTLTVNGTAQTGLLALETPQLLYRLGATLFQPYVWHRKLSVVGGPFLEYRDDLRDRSWAYGLDGSLVWAAGPLRSVSLGYSFSRREILEFGFGEDLEPEESLPILGLADSAQVGQLDRTIKTRRGAARGELRRARRVRQSSPWVRAATPVRGHGPGRPQQQRVRAGRRRRVVLRPAHQAHRLRIPRRGRADLALRQQPAVRRRVALRGPARPP